MQDIQGDGVEKVFHNHSEHRALGCGSSQAAYICGDGHASHSTAMQGIDCLQSCLGTLKKQRDYLTLHIQKQRVQQKARCSKY